MTDRTFEKIEELIGTLICGNQIKGNETYEKMLKGLRVADIICYANMTGYSISHSTVGRSQKLDYLKQIAKV